MAVLEAIDFALISYFWEFGKAGALYDFFRGEKKVFIEGEALKKAVIKKIKSLRKQIELQGKGSFGKVSTKGKIL